MTGRWTLIALCIHGAGLALLRAPAPPVGAANAIHALASETQIAVESSDVSSVAPPPLLGGDRPGAATRSGAARAARSAPSVTSRPTDTADPAEEAFSLGAPATSATEIDLRTGDYWRQVAGEAPRTSDGEPTADAVTRTLRAGLDEHDRAVGLGASGALVAAARTAASTLTAPDVGSATLEIECDAAGHVTDAHLLPPASAAWENVRRELVRLMATRTARVPPGARGVRVRLRIDAERVAPGGSKPIVNAGAVPDDVPGGMDPSGCVGTGLTRTCASGTPLGITVTAVDAANIGAKLVRLVRVHVLGETSL